MNFPAGDCRNDGVRNVVTQAQVDYFVHEFDTNIYPEGVGRVQRAAGTGRLRTRAPGLLGLPADYYAVTATRSSPWSTTSATTTTTTPNNAQALSYIAGFFSSAAQRLLRPQRDDDRRVRLAAPHRRQPAERAGRRDPCTSAPARPHLYEGTFAHEYQHLLESLRGPGRGQLGQRGPVRLGADARRLRRHPAMPITDIGSDSHIQCFLGWLGVQTPANPIPRAAGRRTR